MAVQSGSQWGPDVKSVGVFFFFKTNYRDVLESLLRIFRSREYFRINLRLFRICAVVFCGGRVIRTFVSCLYLNLPEQTLLTLNQMNTIEIDSATASVSSPPEVNMVMESFDLARCSNPTICEPHEFAHQRSPLPPPQKFPTRGGKPQDGSTKCVNHRGTEYFKERSCRAIGAMISREENADWSCTDEQRQNSAQKAATLLVGHKRE